MCGRGEEGKRVRAQGTIWEGGALETGECAGAGGAEGVGRGGGVRSVGGVLMVVVEDVVFDDDAEDGMGRMRGRDRVNVGKRARSDKKWYMILAL